MLLAKYQRQPGKKMVLAGLTHVFNLFNLINHFILLFFLTPGDLI